MPRFDMSEFDATTIAEPPTELSKMAAKLDEIDSDMSDLEADGSAIFHNAQTNQQMLPKSEFGDLSADLPDDARLMARNESVNGGSTASGVDGTGLPAQSDLILGETIMELPNEPGDDDLALSGANTVSKKLDLARHYTDMGDSDGALNTVKEVLQEGDDDQRRQAQELAKKIA
jgi:pilus assembly protein FimV